jgi:hypothetical protein
VVAAIHEELIARHGDDSDRGTLLKVEDRRSTGLDLELAVIDSDLKIGPRQSDPSTDNRELDRNVLPLASDPQADCSVDGPAHFLERLAEGHALGRLVVNMRDDVIGQDASLGGRPVLDRRQHLEETILHLDPEADAAEWFLLVA